MPDCALFRETQQCVLASNVSDQETKDAFDCISCGQQLTLQTVGTSRRFWHLSALFPSPKAESCPLLVHDHWWRQHALPTVRDEKNTTWLQKWTHLLEKAPQLQLIAQVPRIQLDPFFEVYLVSANHTSPYLYQPCGMPSEIFLLHDEYRADLSAPNVLFDTAQGIFRSMLPYPVVIEVAMHAKPAYRGWFRIVERVSINVQNALLSQLQADPLLSQAIVKAREWSPETERILTKISPVCHRAGRFLDEFHRYLILEQFNPNVFKGELCISAVAGAGKTTLLREMVKKHPHVQYLYIVFNKAMQTAMEAQCQSASNVRVVTYDSLCYHIIKKFHERHFELSVANNFYDSTLSKAYSQFHSKGSSSILEAWFHLNQWKTPKHSDFCVAHSSVMIGALHDLFGLLKHEKGKTDVGLTFAGIRAQTSLLSQTAPQEFQRMFQEAFGKYDLILVDEAQDMNAQTVNVLKRLQVPICWVGDPQQAIYQSLYQHKSASSPLAKKQCQCLHTLAKVSEENKLFCSEEGILRLYGSYRVPPIITSFLNEMDASECTKIFSIGAPTTKDQQTVIHILRTPQQLFRNRVNAALFRKNEQVLIYAEAAFPYGNMHLEPRDAARLKGLLDTAERYQQQKQQRRQAWSAPQAPIDNETDKWLQTLTFPQIKEYRNIVTHLENEEPSPESMRLCTIHQVKGLEFDSVMIDGTCCKSFFQDITAQQEEQHVAYVAMTRARFHLFIYLPAATDKLK